jgi:pheromone shutdown protein TraB
LLIFSLIAYGFTQAEDISWEMLQRWFLINGSLASLGAALAFAHPITIVSAFLAAPFTSLNPAVAAGWVAGLVEALVRRPQVKDFEGLMDDVQEFRGFWRNKITRVLLVVVFANLGSTIGTITGGFAIAALL